MIRFFIFETVSIIHVSNSSFLNLSFFNPPAPPPLAWLTIGSLPDSRLLHSPWNIRSPRTFTSGAKGPQGPRARLSPQSVACLTQGSLLHSMWLHSPRVSYHGVYPIMEYTFTTNFHIWAQGPPRAPGPNLQDPSTIFF